MRPQDVDHSTLQDLIAIDAACGIQNYGRLKLGFRRGSGARLWDTEGKEYLDFLGGIAVVTLGHCHPGVTDAIARQAATMVHSSNIYIIEPQVKLAQRLSGLSGGMRAFFCNSGAEANEAALKMARKYFSDRDEGERDDVISAIDGFHGRTYGSLAATGQPKYHHGFEPMPAGYRHVPLNDITALEAAVGDRTAAIMLEPIQGESGIWPCSDEYLEAARHLCDAHGLLLIFDEVQCGMGRSGRFFAHEWTGVKPDIITMAKGLGNGVPIGALLARDEVAGAFVPGTHGCTFGGNFLSCAAALATLDALETEDLMQNAARVGSYFVEQLRNWDILSDVRGRGLIVGASTTQPIARDLMMAALEQGLVINAVGDSMLRFLPPLSITTADVDEAMEKLRRAHATLNAA